VTGKLQTQTQQHMQILSQIYFIRNKTVLRAQRVQNSANAKISTKSEIRNPDCRINPDLDVCRISPKLLWIHHLVGVSRFTKFRKNRPVTV